MKLLLSILPLGLIASPIASASPPTNQKPTMDNFREWVSYIRPEGDEESWREIPWRNNFMPAVEEAKVLDRPILLWAMNGNPCGET